MTREFCDANKLPHARCHPSISEAPPRTTRLEHQNIGQCHYLNDKRFLVDSCVVMQWKTRRIHHTPLQSRLFDCAIISSGYFPRVASIFTLPPRYWNNIPPTWKRMSGSGHEWWKYCEKQSHLSSNFVSIVLAPNRPCRSSRR